MMASRADLNPIVGRRVRIREVGIGLAIRIVAGCCLLPALAEAGPAEREGRRGVRLFYEGEIDEALEAFAAGAKMGAGKKSTPATLQYNLGTVLMEKGDAEGAERALTESLLDNSAPFRGAAFYNLGTNRVREARALPQAPAAPGGPLAQEDGGAGPQERLAQLRSGLGALRQAIITDPTDRDAKHNYEITLELIRELEEQNQESQQGDEGEEQNQQSGGSDEQRDQDQSEEDREENSEGEQSEEEQQPQPSDRQGDSSDQQDPSPQETRQESGLERSPTPAPTPAEAKVTPPPLEPQPSESQPRSAEQLDALRVLNSLEEDQPGQFKRLFQFQGRASSKRLKRDW